MKKEISRLLKKEKEIKGPLCEPGIFKKVFFKMAQEFYAKSNTDFEVDIGNKNFLGHFCKYWNRDMAFEVLENISLRKGLLVFGSYGTGKTSSFRHHPKYGQTVSSSRVVVSFYFDPRGCRKVQYGKKQRGCRTVLFQGCFFI